MTLRTSRAGILRAIMEVHLCPSSLFLNPLASGFWALVLDTFVLRTTAEHGKARAVSTVSGTAFARGVPFDRIHPLGRFLRGLLNLNARQTTAFPVNLCVAAS